MCGGVRGVGAGGIVSSAFCLLYKLSTLKLTRKQINGLLIHAGEEEKKDVPTRLDPNLANDFKSQCRCPSI